MARILTKGFHCNLKYSSTNTVKLYMHATSQDLYINCLALTKVHIHDFIVNVSKK